MEIGLSGFNRPLGDLSDVGAGVVNLDGFPVGGGFTGLK
jgi:hypothetical protein